jgi:hypothetical protein
MSFQDHLRVLTQAGQVRLELLRTEEAIILTAQEAYKMARSLEQAAACAMRERQPLPRQLWDPRG